MHLLIYKKFFVSGSKSKIFTNKVGFRPPCVFSKTSILGAGQSPYLVKMLKMTPNPNGIKHISLGGCSKKIDFTSKLRNRVGYHAHQGAPQDKNIVAGQSHPWVGQTSQLSQKSVILPFSPLFVSYKDSLLKACFLKNIARF